MAAAWPLVILPTTGRASCICFDMYTASHDGQHEDPKECCGEVEPTEWADSLHWFLLWLDALSVPYLISGERLDHLRLLSRLQP